MIFGIFRISGHSMMPVFKPNDRVIVSSIPYIFSKPRIRDVVVFRYNDKMLVKRIIKVSNNLFEIRGDNKNDSLDVNSVKRDKILGKVIFKL